MAVARCKVHMNLYLKGESHKLDLRNTWGKVKLFDKFAGALKYAFLKIL